MLNLPTPAAYVLFIQLQVSKAALDPNIYQGRPYNYQSYPLIPCVMKWSGLDSLKNHL